MKALFSLCRCGKRISYSVFALCAMLAAGRYLELLCSSLFQSIIVVSVWSSMIACVWCLHCCNSVCMPCVVGVFHPCCVLIDRCVSLQAR